MSKTYDIIIWGATGFTGKLACNYLHLNYPQIKFAIAGRDLAKLQEVKSSLGLPESVPILIASITDSDSLLTLTKQTKVILSAAGPFARVGTPIIEACIAGNAHYCDTTGETHWVRKIIDQFHEIAKEKKLRIVNCCGFDSIPSDLGCQLIADELLKRNTQPISVKQIVHEMRGEASGGTIGTVINMISTSTLDELKKLANPFILNPRLNNNEYDQPTDVKILKQAADTNFVSYDEINKTWQMPHIMQGINTRIVNRSNALNQFKYGKNFTYIEQMATSSYVTALFGSIAISLGGLLLFFSFTRNLIIPFLPKPGQGPSQQEMDSGFCKLHFIGKGKKSNSNDITIVKGEVNILDGDPGYKHTATMVTESAICLALDQDLLPTSYGVITPAISMGPILRKRLENRGFQFIIKD